MMTQKVFDGAAVVVADVEPEQLDELSKRARVPFTDAHRAELVALIQDYALKYAFWARAPRQTQVLAALKEIERQVAALGRALQATDGPDAAWQAAGSALRWELSPLAGSGLLFEGVNLDDLKLSLTVLQVAISRAKGQRMPAAGQRPLDDPYRNQFATSLYELFNAAGGKGKISNNGRDGSSGPFLDFLEHALCLAGVPKTKRSTNSVRHTIAAAIPRSAPN